MHIVVLTGAGISAESGLRTFRDAGGLWEGYEVQKVATPEAWEENPDLVTRFYNMRRKDCQNAKPNAGHLALAELEKWCKVNIITQNIDDLHERAGSSDVLHLHGEIFQARSSVDPNLIYELNHWEMSGKEKCELGSPQRPNIVWFGEAVPMMDPAIELVSKADKLLVVGTSLAVYPAASLLFYCKPGVEIVLIDPGEPEIPGELDVTIVKEPASTGVSKYLSSLFPEAKLN